MLSIVIIAKNEEERLPRLLKSIKKQSFKDYEIILSDANSTDNTRKIGRKFGCRIVNGGLPSIGRNNGAKVAHGDLLLFLDGDGDMPAGFLEENIKEFYKRDLAVASPITAPLSDKGIDHILTWLYQRFVLTVQYLSPNGVGAAIFCRKDVFKKAKGFHEERFIGEDHHFIKKCSKYGKFRILKSKPILVDMRRYDREGRLAVVFKYISMGFGELFGAHPKFFNYNMQGVNSKEEHRRLKNV